MKHYLIETDGRHETLAGEEYIGTVRTTATIDGTVRQQTVPVYRRRSLKEPVNAE